MSDELFRADLKLSALRAWSRSESRSEFHFIGPATEKARRPNVLRQCRGTKNWWRLANLRRWRLETLDVYACSSPSGTTSLVLQKPVKWLRVYILDTLRNVQPNVARSEAVGTAIKLPGSTDQPGCRVEHSLKPVGRWPLPSSLCSTDATAPTGANVTSTKQYRNTVYSLYCTYSKRQTIAPRQYAVWPCWWRQKTMTLSVDEPAAYWNVFDIDSSTSSLVP